MGVNIDIFNEWKKTISCYKTLKLKDAQHLYKELTTLDDKLKIKYMEDVILGTLYVVRKFINSSGMLYLNSSFYDMNDIISVCTEIWIFKINSGKLLEINSFSEMFDSDFYNRLCDNLGITKYSIAENTILDINNFIDLLLDYMCLKEKDGNFTYNKFIEYMKNDPRYSTAIHRLYYRGSSVNFLKMFDAIIASFELDDNDMKISKSKLDKLKYILISNGFEYLRADINDIILDDRCDFVIDEICREKIIGIVLNCHSLTTSFKEVIIKRFGLLDGHCSSLDEVAEEQGVTRERIRQKEAAALRKLSLPMYAKQFKDLM